MKWTNRHWKIFWDGLFIAVFCIVLFFLRQNISNIITPFIYALVLAYFLNPLVKLLEKRKVKRLPAIGLTFLALALAIYVLFLSFVPTLVREMSALIAQIPDIFEFLERFFTQAQLADFQLPSFLPEGFLDFLNLDTQLNKLSEMLTSYLSTLPSFFFGAVKSLLNLVMTPLITFYYLKDKERFVGGIYGFLSEEKKAKIKEGAGRIDKVLGGFIRGQLLVAAFVGLLTGIGSWIIGIPNATIIGVVAGLTNIIPYFGPFLGGILPVVLGLMTDPIMALWVVILIAVIQQMESSFLSPQIMSHSVGLHPLTVMFSVLLFGSAMGVAGMILAVPIAGTAKVLLSYVMEYRQSIDKKNAPPEEETSHPEEAVEKTNTKEG